MELNQSGHQVISSDKYTAKLVRCPIDIKIKALFAQPRSFPAAEEFISMAAAIECKADVQLGRNEPGN